MQLVKFGRFFWTLPIAVILTACGGSGDEYEGFNPELRLDTPNRFLSFLNRQGDLPAGEYTLVVGTATAGQSGTFSIMLTRNDDSDAEMFNGSWSSSGGQDADPACASGNRCFAIDMQSATGLAIEMTSTVDGVLYLVNRNRPADVLASRNDRGAGAGELITLAESDIDETEFAEAYNRAVDPGDARTTAQDFISLHGLDNPDAHVVFRDSKDLGYGRDMYMSSYPNPSACGGHVIAFYVRNFSVKIVDGFAYGPVNLQAAVNEDLQHHFGSNAIEWGLGRADQGDTCSSEPMTKFFTYRADYSTPASVHPRLERVDLDDRGAKAMPQPCISCHGGKLRPLDRNGDFVAMHAQDPDNQIGDTKARLQAFEVDTFEFSELPGYTRADLEEGLRQMNAAIYCTYPGSAGHPACADYGGGLAVQASAGEWSGDHGREMLEGWYGSQLGTPGAAYDGSFVPDGWRSENGAPVGADALFTKVVGPNCFVCHGKRGSELGTNSNAGGDGKDVDFRTWEKFVSHADEIERLVYDEGRMPLGLLNYNNFWNDPEKAEILASFIAPYVSQPDQFASRRLDDSGNIILPGRVVARAGLDRVSQPSAPITLSAEASLFADGYRWVINAQPDGASATLSNADKQRTTFTADLEGEYRLTLTASSSLTNGSDTDELTILLDSSLATAPRELDFYTDIQPRLANCASSCHQDGGGSRVATEPVLSEITVWWTENQPTSPTPGVTPTTGLGFYEQVMARVNLEYIEDSLILKKPVGIHHYGGQRAGFDSSAGIGTPDREDYDRFVNWISEGAACGGTAVQCPDR